MALNLGGDRGWSSGWQPVNADKKRASITGRNLGGDRGMALRAKTAKKPKKKKLNINDRGLAARAQYGQAQVQRSMNQLAKKNRKAQKKAAKQQAKFSQQMIRQQAQAAKQLAQWQRQMSQPVKMPSFKVPGLPKMDLPKPGKTPKYPTKPLPIPAEILAQFAQQRAGANRALADAKNAKQLGTGQINADFKQFLRDLGVDAQRSKDAVMGEASARNLAFQPGFVNPRFRDIREDQSRQTADATRMKTQSLQELRSQVAAARRNRQQVLAQIKRDRARHRSQLDRLIGL